VTEKGHVVHVNSATLCMGATGSGKSALLGTLAEYVWETYQKVTRLNTSDGGGFPANIQALMRLGIMQVFRMRTRDLPDGSLSFETCLRASQGWWPQRINPSTGECFPGEKMIPPITERYEMNCPNGHVVKVVPFQSLLTPALCPTCRVMTDRGSMRVRKTSQTTKGFEAVGAVCFDGLSSMLSWMMSDMSQRSGRLELKGEEGAIGGKINSGELKIGGSSRSHYGFAQSQAEAIVLNALSIPGLVVPPVFTALTMETMDEGDLSIRGPKLAGKAKTDEAPAWFGDCLESMVVKNDKDERIYRLYLSEFVDDAGVRHLVKNRAAPGTMPAVLEDPPLKPGQEASTAFTNFNLGVFYTLRDKARLATEAAMDQKYPNAPGLPEGIVEVGEVPPADPQHLQQPPPPAAGVAAPKPAGPAPRPAPPAARPAPAPPAPARPAPARPVPPKPAAASPAAQPVVPAVASSPAAGATPALPAAPPPAGGNGQAKPGAWAAPAAPRPPAQAPRLPPPRVTMPLPAEKPKDPAP
jgi:hypothetical protein